MPTSQRLCLLFCLATLAVSAQTTATPNASATRIRAVSLSDCLTLALQHNLDVQIVRHAPNIARYNLKASFGLQYDPVFSFEAKRENADMPPITDLRKNNPDNPYQVTTDTLETGISGKGWPGFAYELGGYSSELSGNTRLLERSFIVNPGPPPVYAPVDYVIGGESFFVARQRPFDFYYSQVGLNLKQSLLKDSWIDSGRMQIKIAKKNLKISEQSVRLQVMNTVLAVQMAYFDLVYATENVKVMHKALALAEELLGEERRRVAVGTAQPLAASLAESQVQTAQANLLSAQERQEIKQNALRNLLTADFATAPDETLVPTDGMVVVWGNPNRAESLQTALRLRPDLIEARLLVERQGIVVKYHHNQMFPTLDLVGSYGAIGVDDNSRGTTFDTIGDGSYPIYSAGVVLSIPLGNVQARNRYKAAQEVKAQTLLNLKKVEQNVFVQIDDTLKTLEKTFKRVSTTRKATEYAQIALDAEKKKLADGLSTSFLVSEYENRLVTAHIAEILATVEFNKAVAQLAFNEGSALEKNQIKLDFK